MRNVYWDSDCFLAWLQDEVEKTEICAHVLDECKAGKTRLVTSALTLAEVLALRGQRPIPIERRLKVEAFFKNSFIIVRSVTRRTAENARNYVWEHGVAPKDAIHLATAIEANLDDLHTFDRGFMKQSGKHGTPLLRIRNPYVEPNLFTVRTSQ